MNRSVGLGIKKLAGTVVILFLINLDRIFPTTVEANVETF